MRGARVFGAFAGRSLATPAGLVLVLLLLGAPAASAATPAAGWAIESFAAPSVFAPGDNAQCSKEVELCDSYTVTARDAGGVATDGEPVTLTDTLPAGLVLKQVSFSSEAPGQEREDLGSDCTSVPLSCRFTAAVQPDQTLRMIVYVEVEAGASGPLVSTATVSGGGAAQASTSTEAAVGTATPPFGVASFAAHIAGADGLADTQAGAHPYELTTTIDLDNVFRNGPEGSFFNDTSVQDVRDMVIELPLGFLASVLAAPTCAFSQLSSTKGCPSDTAVGRVRSEPEDSTAVNSEIYNMTPVHGVLAELGYADALKTSHVLYASVAPTPAGYVLRVTAREIPQVALTSMSFTLFGDPAATDGSDNLQLPMLTNPSDCSGQPLVTSVHLDSWQHPGSYDAAGAPNLADPAWASASAQTPPVTGCEALAGLFAPSLAALPQRAQAANPLATEPNPQADSPTGLELELKSPASEATETDATPPLQRAVVTLPAGLTVDPSAGDGLQACSIAQIGWLGPAGPGGEPLPNRGLTNFSAGKPECPEGSRVGSLELTTPLFGAVLSGSVYLAAQDENPFQSALAVYLVVDDPATAVVLKLPAELRADPHTGRLAVVLVESPQLAFSDLKLHFSSGPRALLATPESCGAYTTTSALTPWSTSSSGSGSGSGAEPFDAFQIDEGCVGGFAPSFAALSTNVQAGAYTPFEASFSRADADQELGGWSVTLPPGLLADIGSVPLCPEADANAGTCLEASRVGTVLAGAGPGPDPLQVTGKAYLTGPYNGGSFGLSVVVPVIAGPLDLGTVVVRQSLRIDTRTARITDVSNPFPTVLDVTGANGQTDGIPIRLRRVDVTFERAGFIFNPTSCAKLPLTGSISSAEGTSAAVSSPFQVTNCASLKFTPELTVSTQGKTSEANGASLAVKLTYPPVPGRRKAPQGTEANVGAVKIDLPKQLPSRLTTLQQACLAKTFAANPAGCPEASVIGHAKISTPILPTPVCVKAPCPASLEGPAYFVSHGRETFPSLELVLQGDGVTIDLGATTFINKKNVTSVTFRTIPDVPVSSFELTLPEGKYSALGTNKNLCKLAGKLAMPTALTGQNGAEIHKSTNITVTGCKKAHKAKHKKPES
jgi:hypothetical protein